MPLPEGGAAGRRPGVEHRPVRQDQTRADQAAVAVGVGPAAHPGGIVHHDAADHRAPDRSRVRAEFPPVRRQPPVDLRTDDPRLKRYCRIAMISAFLPILSRNNEYTVAEGLPGQACPRSSEGDRQAPRMRLRKDLRHLLLAFAPDHNPGHQPVKTGIRPPGKPPDQVGIDPLLRQETPDRPQKLLVWILLFHRSTNLRRFPEKRNPSPHANALHADPWQ